MFCTPDFLFIQLLRFNEFNISKTQTVVVPEDILVLPNGDKFKLVSIADHLGELIKNGHYVASIKQDLSWLRCNDEKLYWSSDVITSNNYVYVYSKIKEEIVSASNSVDKGFQPESCKKQMLVCQNCQQQFSNLESHYESAIICKQVSKFKKCKITLPRIKVQARGQTANTVKHAQMRCPNCKLSVDSIEDHYKVFKICGQIYGPSNEQGNCATSSTTNQEKPPKVTRLSKGKTRKPHSKLSLRKHKCLSCLKEFVDINNHLSKTFPCQNAYDIDKIVTESTESSVETVCCEAILARIFVHSFGGHLFFIKLNFRSHCQ